MFVPLFLLLLQLDNPDSLKNLERQCPLKQSHMGEENIHGYKEPAVTMHRPTVHAGQRAMQKRRWPGPPSHTKVKIPWEQTAKVLWVSVHMSAVSLPLGSTAPLFLPSAGNVAGSHAMLTLLLCQWLTLPMGFTRYAREVNAQHNLSQKILGNLICLCRGSAAAVTNIFL